MKWYEFKWIIFLIYKRCQNHKFIFVASPKLPLKRTLRKTFKNLVTSRKFELLMPMPSSYFLQQLRVSKLKIVPRKLFARWTKLKLMVTNWKSKSQESLENLRDLSPMTNAGIAINWVTGKIVVLSTERNLLGKDFTMVEGEDTIQVLHQAHPQAKGIEGKLWLI